MKFVLTILLGFLSWSSFSQTERVWEKIEDAPVITPENAAEFLTHENTLESVMNYFFASQIRKDTLWENVVLSHYYRGERMQRKLEQYSKWTITKFNLVSKTEYAPGKFYVKVYFELTGPDGRKDGGIDQAEIQLVNHGWIIISVPT